MGRIKASRSIVGIVAGLVMITSFQNCGGNFEFSSGVAGLGSHEDHTNSAIDFSLRRGSSTVAVNQIAVGQVFQIDFVGVAKSSVTYTYDVVNNRSNCTLSAGEVPLGRALTCTVVNQTSDVRLIATYGDGTIKIKSNTISTIPGSATPTPTPSGGAADVTFSIVAGTAANPWNTAAQYVLVFVGQRLRIINNDTVAHQVHTGGSPFAHQNNPMPAGTSADFVITSSHENPSAGDVYDHIAGTGAQFYIKAIDGTAKYNTSCMGCHNPLATSTKKNKSFNQIKNAIMSVGAMASLQTTLSDDDIRAIAYQLSRP